MRDMKVVTEKAPKFLKGTVNLLGRILTVNAQLQREVGLYKDPYPPYATKSHILTYEIRGKLEGIYEIRSDFPQLFKFIGCCCLVDFGNFTFRCKLLDSFGNLGSIGAPETVMEPEELWIHSGGM